MSFDKYNESTANSLFVKSPVECDEENQNKSMDRIDELLELIQQQNDNFKKVNEDLQKQLTDQNEINETNAKRIEKLEMYIELFDCDSSTQCNQNQNEAEALLLMQHQDSTNEFNCNDPPDVVRFDIPSFFSCILRFTYAILYSFEVMDWRHIYVNYYLIAVQFALLIIFEMLTESLYGKFRKISTAFVVGGIAQFALLPYYIGNSTMFFIPWLSAAIIMILAEAILILQMLKNGISKMIILSHTFHLLSILILSIGGILMSTIIQKFQERNIAVLRQISVLFTISSSISLLHPFLMLFGLLTKQSNDINQNFNDVDEHEENINDNVHESIPDTSNNKSIISVSNEIQDRIQSLQSQSTKSDNNFSRNGLRFKGLKTDRTTSTELSLDVYTIMMISQWTEKTFRNPFSCCTKKPILITIPRPSKSWVLGSVVFVFQTSLAFLILVDQITVDFGNIPFNIPFEVSSVVRVGQFITLILAVTSQTDIFVAYRIVSFLRYKNNDWRELIEYEKNERSFTVWLGRILVPNLMKSFQGLIVLGITFILIVHSSNIVDLLKDFTSLFVISSIDEMFFFMVDHGYLGLSISRETRMVKEKKIKENDKKIHLPLFLFLIVFTMFGGWIAVVVQQMKYSSLRKKYPGCILEQNAGVIRDDKCDYAKNFGSNTLECGWDGGDCEIFNEKYPNCKVQLPYLIGDGVCYGDYNLKECGYDGEDCLEMNFELNRDYPNCTGHGIYPPLIGDGFCNYNQNTKECGFDGGDCLKKNAIFIKKYPNCTLVRSNLVGDGICGTYHNTEECGYDGGDCKNCTVDDLSLLGNGQCDGDKYNTAECGFDGGDCIELNYPNCKVDKLFYIGDGLCDGGPYNTPDCGFDGGDCEAFNKKYPECRVDHPYLIGDGECNIQFSVKECGFDGGDCSLFDIIDDVFDDL